MDILDFVQGFIIGSSLIIAIGPQNLFVINQGLKLRGKSKKKMTEFDVPPNSFNGDGFS